MNKCTRIILNRIFKFIREIESISKIKKIKSQFCVKLNLFWIKTYIYDK